MKLVHIVGARPQFIKLAPLYRAIRDNSDAASIILHTGQHYDYLMSKVFFDELQLPEPDYNLNAGSGSHGQQTGLMLARIEEVLIKENPDIVIVYGDTNSTLAGALAASKLHIPVAHVEAGLRSYNWKMPEEINRVLTDHISTILFCPTKAAVINLQKEGFNALKEGELALKEGELIDSSDVFTPFKGKFHLVAYVGDVMFDSVLFSLQKASQISGILKTLDLQLPQGNVSPYILCTIHRQENTDDQERLKAILNTLDSIASTGMTAIVPMHPRTRKILDSLNVGFPHLKIIQPVSYFDMLILQKKARLILTDSGGVQKEAFFVQVPCITLREETEWLETVSAGMNIVSGIDKEKILCAYSQMITHSPEQYKEKLRRNPFGDGNSSSLILKIILSYLKSLSAS